MTCLIKIFLIKTGSSYVYLTDSVLNESTVNVYNSSTRLDILSGKSSLFRGFRILCTLSKPVVEPKYNRWSGEWYSNDDNSECWFGGRRIGLEPSLHANFGFRTIILNTCYLNLSLSRGFLSSKEMVWSRRCKSGSKAVATYQYSLRWHHILAPYL